MDKLNSQLVINLQLCLIGVSSLVSHNSLSLSLSLSLFLTQSNSLSLSLSLLIYLISLLIVDFKFNCIYATKKEKGSAAQREVEALAHLSTVKLPFLRVLWRGGGNALAAA